MNVYSSLLFLHGHVADARLAAALSHAAPVDVQPARHPPGAASGHPTAQRTHPWREPMNLFKSLWYLGGLQSIDLRIGDDEEESYGRSYGNRLASERLFGKPAAKTARCRVAAPARGATLATDSPVGCVAGNCG